MDAQIEYAGRTVKFCDVNSKDYIEGLLLQGVWYELPNLQFIQSLKVPGTYVDVGAYIGTHSLFFSLFTAADQVYAFEANQPTFHKLCTNLDANAAYKCLVLNCAIGKEQGTAEVHEAGETNRGATWVSPVPAGQGTVDMLPLDQFNLTDVSLLKIDVEGAEMNVLLGAQKTLPQVQHLFVEMWSEKVCQERHLQYTVPLVTNFLKSFGLHLDLRLTEDLYYFKKG